MRWKKRFSGVFLFLTLLHCALCNRQSHEKIGQNGKDEQLETVIVPGPETAILQSGHIVHLDNMSFLDPYNMMASMKKVDKGEKDIMPGNPLLNLGSDHSSESDSKTKETSKSGKLHNESNSDERGDKQDIDSMSPSLSKSAETTDVTKAEQHNKELSSTETSPFGENDFDLYDDYTDFDNMESVDFDNVDFRRGRRRKWNKRHEERNALLHEAVRKLLGFSQSPKMNSKHRRLLPDPNREDKLPRYVKDLYERFQSGEMSAGLAKGNTVRSIHGKIGQIDGKSVFLFNLSSLRSSEELLNAEIHLYKRRLRHKVTSLDIEVRLFQVASHKFREAGKIVMREPGFGWQWYDVTTAVKNCLTPRHQNLFALSFRANKSNGKSKPVSLRKFGKHHSMPFLVLYSNETEAASFDQLDLLADRLWANGGFKLDQTPLSPTGDRAKSTEQRLRSANRPSKSRTGDSRRATKTNRLDSSSNDGYEDTDFIHSSTSAQQRLKSSPSRGKRSIYNNEIPEGPAVDFKRFHYYNKIPHTHPGILKTRKESKVDFDDRGLTSPDRRVGGHRRRRKKHRNKKHRRGRLEFPKEWDDYVIRKNGGKKQSSDVCGRKKLSVDFADIGWGDWIISPKSFEAHYCSGSCPFPIMKHLRPSNHATIQSIVHAIGIHKKVPAPCCVPDVMSSVTLLYFDEDRNVVLKNYPGMTVDSCACR